MEEKKSHTAMLDLMLQPGFIVQNNVIQKANQAAQSLQLTPGLDVRELLLTRRCWRSWKMVYMCLMPLISFMR